MVVGYSAKRLLTTSAATDKTESSGLGFGILDLRFVFSHSGADIIKRRTKDIISSGSSCEESTTKTLQSKISRVTRVGGLRTLHPLLPATIRHVLGCAPGLPSRDTFAPCFPQQDQRGFRQCRQGSRDGHQGAESDRHARSGEASPSWEGHHMYSTYFSCKRCKTMLRSK
jgi:hypothetical protein